MSPPRKFHFEVLCCTHWSRVKRRSLSGSCRSRRLGSELYLPNMIGGNGSDMEIRIIITATTEIGKLKWRTRVRCCHHNKTREFYRSIKGKDHVWRGTSLFVLIPICPLTDIEFLSGVSLFYSLAAGSPRGSSLGLFINPDVL